MDMHWNYIQNTKTSKERNLRIEITGKVSENEKNFLNGISYFTASTLGKGSETHLRYVSGLMVRLIQHISARKKAGI